MVSEIRYKDGCAPAGRIHLAHLLRRSHFFREKAYDMNMRNFLLVLPLIAATALTGCRIAIDRNADGSLSLESTLAERHLQREIRAALADPLMEDLAVDFRNGWIQVEGLRRRLRGDQTDTLRFRLDLGVDGGQLTAHISEGWFNNWPIDEDRLALWNARIVRRLNRAGDRHPNRQLQDVTVTDDELRMEWRID